MEIEIRPVRPHDHDAVRRLAPRLLIGVDPSRPPELVRHAVDGWVRDSLAAAGADDHASWVAMAGDTVVGFVSVTEDEHWCGQTDAWVGELVVDERQERQGVARSLVARAEDWARERGLTRVRLSTGAANHGALAFYERIGYEPTDVTLTRELGAAPGG